jgi:hypothetical protein
MQLYNGADGNSIRFSRERQRKQLNCTSNRTPNIPGTGRTPQIRRAWRPALGIKHFFNCSQHRIMRIFVTQEAQHHRARPNLANRVGNSFAGNVGR